jgi:hypothetical protein
MDDYLLGSWEGFVTLRLDPAPSTGFTFFDSNSTTAVRIRFSSIRALPEPLASQVLSVWPDEAHSGQKLLDATVSAVDGTVENFQGDVLGSDRTCLSSLAGRNGSNPFQGATSSGVMVYRYPGMHGAGSEAVVMDFPVGTEHLAPTGMSVPFFIKASTLITRQTRFEMNEFPHSLHNGFELGGLHKVTGGGGPCSHSDD